MRKSFKASFFFLFAFFLICTALSLPAKAAGNVVFVRDGGTGDGSTAENALGNGEGYDVWTDQNTYKKSALCRAAELLRDTGGTIVVCGEVTIRWGEQSENSAKSASGFRFPSTAIKGKTIKITSVYDGIDYRTNGAGAAVVLARTPRQALSIELFCATVWYRVNLRTTFEEGTSTTLRNFTFCCNGYKTDIQSLSCYSYFVSENESGEIEYTPIEKTPENYMYFPLLSGGARYKNITADPDLTVRSGTWKYVCGGSVAFTQSSLLSKGALNNRQYSIVNGSTSLTFMNSAVALTGVSGGCYSNGGCVTGSTTLTVKGGTIYGEINSSGNGGLDENNGGSICTVTGGNLENVTSVLSSGGTLLYHAPKTSVLDLTALPSEDADRLYGLTYGFSEIRYDGSAFFAKEELYSPSEEVIGYLLTTGTSKKDFFDAFNSILFEKGGANILTLIGMLTPAPQGDPDFSDANNTDVVRERTIEYFNRMSEVEWICAETMDFREEKSYTTKLFYEAGKTYYGLPYTSTRRPGACLEEFLDYLSPSRVYIGPTTYDDLVGGDCGSPRRALAYSGAIVNAGMTLSDFEFFEPLNSPKRVIVPIEGYDYSHFDRTIPTTDCILAYNTEDAIYESYAKLQKADLLGRRFYLKGKIAQHIRLVTEDAVAARSLSGKIVPSASFIVFSEQSSTPSVINGKNTTWKMGVKISFTDLYADGYAPLTTLTLASGQAVQPIMTFDTQGKTGDGLIGYGSVTCNYNILQIDALFTDRNGNVVSSYRFYPYKLTTDIPVSIYGLYRDLSVGSYTYTLKATIGPGTKTLCTIDFEK